MRLTLHKHWLMRRLIAWPGQRIAVTARSGPLMGKRLLLGTRRGFRRGTYEPEQTQAFTELIREGDVVYDIGAHMGYYTLLASTLVGDSGLVVSFEPLPANLAYLRRHVRLNKCDNVRIITACVSDRVGVCQFDRESSSGTGHIADDGKLSFPTVTLDSLVEQGDIPPPDFVKIDVEGAEYLVLQGAQATISVVRPTIFLSPHGGTEGQWCFDFLAEHGYALRPIDCTDLQRAEEVLATPSGGGLDAGETAANASGVD